ncbi:MULTISPECIES: AraC family transcriptional regulator [Streptomyces]|uniref:AraC-like DNA-binding protein n=1 Tax=Streptomyces demainii TaxID=588122 RepID=A0ABT9KL51_9ACTN|nr:MULTISPECIES: AraC family transcriptional regulator [Streptomyces]MBW8091835.1 AraC family transcriptional regulator [Streptomyces hygroscopicus subsp. hygroscopicus]MCO8306878.1 AraC family transcriptional regulator [Streptomyces sp. RKCA744]MDN3053059.1 AraC family transcriptional regulator [Streptomyces sp. SRF1]MDP9609163.1 AraC-like DNA-binding protein [Streptomyces demainii]
MTESPQSLTGTPDGGPEGQYALSSDLISELLTSMRLRGVRYRRVHAGPRFGLAFDAKPGHVHLHFLAVGSAVLRTEDGTLHELSAGNAVFMPHGQSHQLLSDPDIPARGIESFAAVPLSDAVCDVDACPSAATAGAAPPPSAIFFTGSMEFDLGGMQGLSQLMPDVMLVNATGKRYPGLMPILASMRRELCSARVGFAGILARLAEVAAAMIVRGWIECGCDSSSGLVAALRDPRLARAILALHRRPGHHWTVAELAAECHVSRSVFADRFQATIGMPPLRYATELRMLLASQWLAQDTLPIQSVALRLGYTSQAAFSRAFKRVTGRSPGASRNAASLVGSPSLAGAARPGAGCDAVPPGCW